MELIMGGTKNWYMEEEEKILQEVGDEYYEEKFEREYSQPCEPCFDDYPHFRIENHGSIVTFTPLNDAATGWWLEEVEPDCQMVGKSYAVENRFAPDIIKEINYAITGR